MKMDEKEQLIKEFLSRKQVDITSMLGPEFDADTHEDLARKIFEVKKDPIIQPVYDTEVKSRFPSISLEELSRLRLAHLAASTFYHSGYGMCTWKDLGSAYMLNPKSKREMVFTAHAVRKREVNSYRFPDVPEGFGEVHPIHEMLLSFGNRTHYVELLLSSSKMLLTIRKKYYKNNEQVPMKKLIATYLRSKTS